MIVEYCCNGNLLHYLRSKRNDQSSPLTARHCVDMAAQVATGMEFLASKDVCSVNRALLVLSGSANCQIFEHFSLSRAHVCVCVCVCSVFTGTWRLAMCSSLKTMF